MPAPTPEDRTRLASLRRLLAVRHYEAKERLRRAPVRRYRHDIVAFAHDCLRWEDGRFLTDYQQESLANLVTYGRECVRGPRGLGKTFDESIAVNWFALTRDGDDWKCITTAGSWHQLTAYLWPEIHKVARMLRWERIGRDPYIEGTELLMRELKLTTGQATAASPDKPDLIEGAHADHVLLVLDEAKIISNAIFDSVEGALSVGECYALACSTPGEPSGRFCDIQKRRAGTEDWHATHVTKERVIAAGRMNPDWAESRRQQWGEDSAVYINQVLGDFASSGEDTVIPLSWVEAAFRRWDEWRESGAPAPPSCVGVDVARGGEDKTVLARRSGQVITELRPYAYADTMETTGRVAGALRGGVPYAVVDVIGIGAGVVDRLREQGFSVVAFNAGERTDMLDQSGELGFANKRSAAWWSMRELLDPANESRVALPEDAGGYLVGDLTAPKWRTTSGGKIAVESKDDIRKRLGRSTDYADAVIQAFWHEPPPAADEVIVYEDEPDWMPAY